MLHFRPYPVPSMSIRRSIAPLQLVAIPQAAHPWRPHGWPRFLRRWIHAMLLKAVETFRLPRQVAN